jgi:hypothetical protein
MSLPTHVALTMDGVQVPTSDLTKVAAALSKQVLRDFGPVWSVQATIDPFPRLDDVPIDYWPIIVTRGVRGAAGYHEDHNGQPYSLVEFDQEWSLTASHECLEMLADPFGRRLRAGNMPDQAIGLGFRPGRVQFLVEVCDPSEAGQFSYQVNGVTVSDFYTTHYFDPVKASGVRYSFTGAIDAPRKVLDDGYVSYRDPVSKHWFQIRMFPDRQSSAIPHVVDLTNNKVFADLIQSGTNLRAAIDVVTPRPSYARSLRGAALMAHRVGAETAEASQVARAEAIRGEIRKLKRQRINPDETRRKR